MSQVKGDLTNAKDASNLGILRRDAMSRLLKLIPNDHLHFLKNLDKLKLFFFCLCAAAQWLIQIFVVWEEERRCFKIEEGIKITSKKSKKAGASSTSTFLVEPATTSTSLITQAPISPGSIRKRMAVSTSTSTKPPDSPLSQPTTRTMATHSGRSTGGAAGAGAPLPPENP